MACEDLLDNERLLELAEEVGSEDLIAVLLMFLDEAEGEIGTLPERLDDDGHAKSMHFLRSGALNIGFRALAEAALQAESLPPQHRSAAADQLASVVSRSRAAVLARG